MGRWAQRVRAGGTVNQFNSITNVQFESNPEDKDLTYANVVNAASLVAATFASQPSGEVGASIAQLSANVIRVTFTGDVSMDTETVYSGNTVGFRTPQTFP